MMPLSSSSLPLPTAGGAQHIHVSFVALLIALSQGWISGVCGVCVGGSCVFCVPVLNTSALRQKLHLAENQDLPKTSGP